MRIALLALLLFAMSLIGCSNSTPPSVTTEIPIADFVVFPMEGEAPLIVSCQNLTTPINADMNWMFSDGGISNDLHPVYTFNDPGTYSIVLIATNSTGASDMIVYGIEVNGTVPPPPPGSFPPGPDELQVFTYFGINEVIPYTQSISADFSTPIYFEEYGIAGQPSQLGGFSVSFNYEFEGDEDFAVATGVEWSDWVMSLNGGNGPDLVIGGLYDDNEVNMGCIANTAAPIDYWYLPVDETVELVRIHFITIPWVLLNQTPNIDFFIEDSVATNATNVVVVNMPVTGAASASIDNGHLVVQNWKVTLEP